MSQHRVVDPGQGPPEFTGPLLKDERPQVGIKIELGQGAKSLLPAKNTGSMGTT